MVQENNQGRNKRFAPDSHYIIRIFRYHKLSPFPDSSSGNGLNMVCQKKELLCLLCLICLADCFGKLITTGGILETTLDPLDLGFDPVNGLTVNQTGYGFEVAVAATGEGYVADHISVNVKMDL